MSKLIFLLFSVSFFINCFSQNEEADSLITLLKTAKEDTSRVNILNDIAVSYFNTSPENALKYGTQAQTLAETAGYVHGLAYAYKNIGIAHYMQADYIQTLTYWNQSLKQFEDANDKKGIANILSNLGAVYSNEGDDAKALDYYLKALRYAQQINDTLRLVTVLNNIGSVYFNKASTQDKALGYYLKALPMCEKLGDNDAIGTITVNIGEIYLGRNEDTLALKYFERSAKAYQNSKNLPYSLNDIAKVYEKRKDYTTALKYHQQALDISEKLSARLEMSQSYQGIAIVYAQKKEIAKALQAYKNAETIAKEIAANYELEKIYKGLSDAYATINDYPNAYTYQSLLITVKDTLYNAEKDKKLAFLQFNFEIQKKQTEIDLLMKDKTMNDLELKTQKTVKNSLIAVLSLVILLVFILFRNYRIKDKTNSILDAQKKELEQTLAELRSAQSQLIQAEKMASLGELTAGIAHEIQNPLNFINNFSEVNRELIEELKTERSKLKTERDEKSEIDILNDIAANGEKVIHHGRRADAIVKGMLQHSRKNTGQKEPTDINALCDEYLRLSYHGLRAKGTSFNADFKTDFDSTIGKINIIPQDFGRVLLNLFNNAFYAVNERHKVEGSAFKPVVSVQTKKLDHKIQIKISDNGNGISQKIIDKIFQPFFTTKPAGSGTGLGLSLSYDIIKAHGGEIKVETAPAGWAGKIDENNPEKPGKGKGTTFIIQIPVR